MSTNKQKLFCGSSQSSLVFRGRKMVSSWWTVLLGFVLYYRPCAADNSTSICNSTMHTLYLANSSLSKVPNKFNTRCLTPITLDLSNNYISELTFPEGFFHSYPFENVYINNNRLSSLHGLEQFKGHALFVDNNRLSSLDFINNWNGRLLSVNNNVISRISLINSTNLLELYASSNTISFLDLSGANKLRILSAKHNSIRNIVPPTNSCSLEHIFIGNNHLRYLPDAIEKCPNVTILDVSQNYIIEFNLPMITKTQQCITHFGWTDNFPSGWEPPYKCNLESVDLHRNQIQSISEGVLMCPKLRYLNISNNMITDMPDVLVRLLTHKEACGTKADEQPEIVVDLRNNNLKSEDVIRAFKKFAKVQGNILNFWEDNCECSVLRIENMKFAPVRYCITSMCGLNRRNEWKYFSTIH